MKQNIFISTFFLLSALFFSCNNKEQQSSSETPVAKPVLNVPAFNPDSALEFTKAQVVFGPRVPNSPAHDQCAGYIISTLKKFADTVIVQQFQAKNYEGKMLNGKNIIGSFHPGKGNRILLCAHWDSRHIADRDSVRKNEPIDGANDGAAGVGILMEVARQLSIAKPELGVDILFFDLEDGGQPDDSNLPPDENSWCLGSQYWSNNLHVPNYFARFGILLDMPGAAGATFTQEGTSMQYAPEVVEHVWKIASDIGYSDYFIPERTNPITDDHFYVNSIAKIKVIDIIHHDFSSPTNFWKHWHTHGDTIDKVDPKTLKVVGQVLLQVLYEETIL